MKKLNIMGSPKLATQNLWLPNKNKLFITILNYWCSYWPCCVALYSVYRPAWFVMVATNMYKWKNIVPSFHPKKAYPNLFLWWMIFIASQRFQGHEKLRSFDLKSVAGILASCIFESWFVNFLIADISQAIFSCVYILLVYAILL